MSLRAVNRPLGFSANFSAAAAAAQIAAAIAARPGIPLIAHLRLTNAQILAGLTPVVLLAGIAGNIVLPIACLAVGDASAGSYGVNLTLNIRYTGNTTVLITPGQVFNGGSATRRVGMINKNAATVYDTATFNPAGAGLSAIFNANGTNGNAANYCDITVAYLLVGNPT